MQEWPTANKKRKAIHFCSRQLGSRVYRVPALTAFDRLAVCFHIRRNALVEICSYLVRKGDSHIAKALNIRHLAVYSISTTPQKILFTPSSYKVVQIEGRMCGATHISCLVLGRL